MSQCVFLAQHTMQGLNSAVFFSICWDLKVPREVDLKPESQKSKKKHTDFG